MNEKNVKIIMIGLITIVSIICLTISFLWITTPTDFIADITINHNADNNTKALYDALGKNVQREIDNMSCIEGCKNMWDKFASTPNTVAIDGFYKSDCWKLCE